MMPNQPNFPIPEELTPDTFCLCLQIPNDPTWKQVFVGLLAQPTYWFNWDRDEARSGKQLADYWTTLFDQIDWSTMSCCCNQPPAIFRYGPGGVYQRSTDGGVTWVDAPEYNYTNTSTTFPDPADLGISNTKCQAADGAVVILNEDVIQGLDNGSAVQALLEFIAAVLIFYLSAGTLATISIGLFSMAAAIIGFGVAATKAAFTGTVLDQLRCTFYCNMNSDSSIDEAGIARVLKDINDNYTGIVKTSLYSLISSTGAVGITNMMRSNRGAADADCSGCSCPEICPDGWEPYDSVDGRYGVIDSQIDGTYTIHCDVPINVSGHDVYYIYIHRADGADCCFYEDVVQLTGATAEKLSVECGHDEFDIQPDPGTSGCKWVMQWQCSTPFSLSVHFDDCP